MVVTLPGVLVSAGLIGRGVVGVVVGVLLGLGLQRHHTRGVEHVLVAALGDGLVDRRLEALDVDHGVAVGDRGDLTRGELDVVRLGSRLGQAGDHPVISGDALGDELQRIEGRDDPQLSRLRRRLAASAAGCGQEERAAEDCGAERAGDDRHGNHFQLSDNDYQIGQSPRAASTFDRRGPVPPSRSASWPNPGTMVGWPISAGSPRPAGRVAVREAPAVGEAGAVAAGASLGLRAPAPAPGSRSRTRAGRRW